MDLEALQERAHSDIKKFESEVGEKDYDEILFLYLSKISEDIGNLSSSVMAHEGFGKSNMETSASFANALYSIVVLGKKMNIDLSTAMAEKIKEIEAEE